MKAWLVIVALGLVACDGEVDTVGSSTGGGGSSSSQGGGGTGGTSSTGGSGGEGTGGGGGSSGVRCNPSEVFCFAETPTCQPGEVPEVIDGCWGDCVPILSCAAEPSCDSCQTGFCAEYQAFTVEYRCVMPSLMCSALACGCLAPYFCAEPYDTCAESTTDADVICVCPNC